MRARLRIDLDAIRRNIVALRAIAAPAGLAAVVKANAYGHGLIEVGRTAAGVADRLCVYELDEALALRDAGVGAPIHVLGPIAPAELDAAHAANVHVSLWDTGTYARQAASIARRRRARIPVPLKIDTGVTRFGVRYDVAPAALATWSATPEFDVAGVFSHLAAAEELESAYTREQVARFRTATAAVANGVQRHLAASAAAILYPETRFDLVRAGIAIYGIWPSDDTELALGARDVRLAPALTWTTEVIAVQEVPADTSVGYGCTFRTTRPSRIGILPIGYAEGIPRAAGGRAYALVAGRRVPLVGRVCMNTAFVDLTGVAEARSGSTVTLIGADGSERLRVEDWGGWCGTIGYEIVARLPSHVPRDVAGAPRVAET